MDSSGIQDNSDVLHRISKKSPLQKRHQMFEQLVFVATVVEKDFLELASYTLSIENLTTNSQEAHSNPDIRSNENKVNQDSTAFHGINTTAEKTETNTDKSSNSGAVQSHFPRRLKCSYRNLKKTKIAPTRKPQSFVHLTKTVRVTCRSRIPASKPQVRSIMKYRF